MNPTTNNWE